MKQSPNVRYYLSWSDETPDEWLDVWFDNLEDAMVKYNSLNTHWVLLEQVSGSEYETVCEK